MGFMAERLLQKAQPSKAPKALPQTVRRFNGAIIGVFGCHFREV
jgi:hypothetical protein